MRGADMRGRAGAPDDAALSAALCHYYFLQLQKKGVSFLAHTSVCGGAFLYLLEMKHYQNLTAQYTAIFIMIFKKISAAGVS